MGGLQLFSSAPPVECIHGERLVVFLPVAFPALIHSDHTHLEVVTCSLLLYMMLTENGNFGSLKKITCGEK